MDLDEAIRKAVKTFYDGAEFENYNKVKGSKSSKYSQQFFDDYESDLRKGRKKKGSTEVEVEEVE